MTAAFSLMDLIAAGLAGVLLGVLTTLSFASLEHATDQDLQ